MRGFAVLLALACAGAALIWLTNDAAPARTVANGPAHPASVDEATLLGFSPVDGRDLSLVPGPPLVVLGQVVALGRPVADARVNLFRCLPFSVHALDPRVRTRGDRVFELATAAADAEGRFELRARRCSRVVVYASAVGLAPGHLVLRTPSGGNPRPFRLELEPGHPFRGRLVGAPAPMRVFLDREDGEIPVAEATIGPDGGFGWASVAAGTYTLRVGRVRHSVTVPHYGVQRFAVEAPPERKPPVRLAGRVVGGPAVVALVRADDGHVEEAVTRTGSDGAFAFDNVQPGSFRFVARGRDSGGQLPADRRAMLIPASRTDLEIRLVPGGRIEGQVDGNVETVHVRAGRFLFSARVDANGWFAFPFVPAGQRVRVHARRHLESDLITVAAGAMHRVVLRDPAPPPHGRFRGVVHGPDGRPVAGAQVALEAADDTPPVRTDHEGRFDLPFAAPDLGTWTLAATKPEYPTTRLRGKGPPPVDVELRLEAGATFRALVSFQDGSPAAGAAVRIEQDDVVLGATADDEGRIRVPGLWPSDVKVQVRHAGGRLPVDDREWANVTWPAREARLELVSVSRIAGRVVDDEQRPLPGVLVILRHPRAWSPSALEGVEPRLREIYAGRLDITRDSVREAWTDNAGGFRMDGVPDGIFEIVLEPHGYAVLGILRTVVSGIEGGREDLVLQPNLGHRIRGRVVDADGRAVRGARVIGGWREPEGWNTLMHHQSFRPSTETAEDGSFVLTGLPPEFVDLIVYTPGRKPLLRKRVAVGGDVELRLERGVAIEGRITDADGAPRDGVDLKVETLDDRIEAWVELIEELGGSGWAHATPVYLWETTTDGDGRFRFAGLPDGRYRIQLDRLMVDWDDPILPETIVTAGADPITIVAPDPLTIAGQVVDETGQPVVRYDRPRFREPLGVLVALSQGGAQVAWDFVDHHGRFSIGGLTRGEVLVRVDAGDEFEPFKLRVAAGAHDLRLVLRRKR